MSPAVSAADLWVDDLENLLGLHPMQRPDQGTDHKRQKKRGLASLRPIYVAALVVGVTAVFVELNRPGSSTSVAERSTEPSRSEATDMPVVLPSPPSRMAGAPVAIPSEAGPDTARDLAYSDASTRGSLGDRAAQSRMAGSERSATVSSRRPKAQAVASDPTLSSSERSQIVPAERKGTMSADAGNLPPAHNYVVSEPLKSAPTAPDIGVGKDAEPKSAPIADDLYTPAATYSARPTPPSVPGAAQSQSSDATFPREARVRSNASRKKPIVATEAIDALRMLRRQ